MFRINEWILPRKELLAFLGAIVCSIILLLSNDSRQIDTIKSWVLGGSGYILEKISVVYRLNNLYDENHWLRIRSSRLMLENSRLKEALQENQRLRALLRFKSESKLDLVPAKVIGEQKNGLVNAIMVSSGAADGLERNMAVVTAAGLVGKVYRLSAHYAFVQLLLDRNFRVSATVQRSRVNGIIKWQQGNQVVLSEVVKRSDVKIGDAVISSGYSSIFPGGLLIGHVAEITDKKNSLFVTVLVNPSVDFSKLEEVLIIKKRQSVREEK